MDSKIADQVIMEVTSTSIKDSTTGRFHEEGLFSEEIFGELASPNRLSRKGYIDLRCEIFHPRVFKIIVSLKRVYKEIMRGGTYAHFDEKLGDFRIAHEDDDDAETGMLFFMEHFPKIKFKETGAIKRDTKIKVFKKYPNQLAMDKYLVLPAGIRDYEEGARGASTEEINKLYASMINYSRALPVGGSDNPMFNMVRYSLQLKAVEIFEYLKNFMDGKKGFLQGKYGSRSVALASRNVFSSADTNMTSAKDPKMIKYDETQLPLFQTAKILTPRVVHNLKAMFFSGVFSEGSSQIPLFNPKNNTLEYVEVSPHVKDKFLTSDGIAEFISAYRHAEIRHNAVTVKLPGKKKYNMYLKYWTGDNIYITRSIESLKTRLTDKGIAYNPELLTPLTYSEMLYMATYAAAQGKFMSVTRYPITGLGSIYTSKIHVITTNPSKTVKVQVGLDSEVEYAHWPMPGVSSVDSMIPHPCRMSGMGGDFDGDTGNAIPILSTEACNENAEYIKSPSSVINEDGTMAVGLNTDLCKLTIYNLSVRPNKKAIK